MKFVVIDTETGGIDPKEKSLLTIGVVAVELKNGQLSIIDKIGLRCKHEQYNCDKQALEVNKIDLVEHDKKALSKELVTKHLGNFLDKYDMRQAIIVGQNIEFDIGFLKEYFQTSYPFNFKKLDSMQVWTIAKMLGVAPTELKDNLSTMAMWLDISYEGAHNALTDCIITINVINKLLKLINEKRELGGEDDE